jgi:hypothetical protein
VHRPTLLIAYGESNPMARIVSIAALAALAVILALLGVGFLAAALFLALRETMPQHLAALVSGTALLLMAVLLVMVVGLRKRAGEHGQPAEQPPNLNRIAIELGGTLGRQASAYSRTHPWATAGLSLACGAVVGASPRLRGALLALLRGAATEI